MIVDLVRNDLGRVAITGTVTLPMASDLDAAFPPASVRARRRCGPVSCCVAGSRIDAECIAAQSV
jgi:hypothetical protein